MFTVLVRPTPATACPRPQTLMAVAGFSRFRLTAFDSEMETAMTSGFEKLEDYSGPQVQPWLWLLVGGTTTVVVVAYWMFW
jgi:hypothetical protein